MSKINITLDVPNDLMQDIMSNNYELKGLALNSKNKQVVKHIEPTKVKINNPSTTGFTIGINALNCVITLGSIVLDGIVKSEQLKQKYCKKVNTTSTNKKHIDGAEIHNVGKSSLNLLCNKSNSISDDVQLN